MKKTKFTETQMVKAIAEHEKGRAGRKRSAASWGLAQLHSTNGARSMVAWK
jgi:hypothetical protein